MKRQTFSSSDLLILLRRLYIDRVFFSVELNHKYLFIGGYDEAAGIRNSQ